MYADSLPCPIPLQKLRAELYPSFPFFHTFTIKAEEHERIKRDSLWATMNAWGTVHLPSGHSNTAPGKNELIGRKKKFRLMGTLNAPLYHQSKNILSCVYFQEHFQGANADAEKLTHRHPSNFFVQLAESASDHVLTERKYNNLFMKSLLLVPGVGRSFIAPVSTRFQLQLHEILPIINNYYLFHFVSDYSIATLTTFEFLKEQVNSFTECKKSR